jgi:hypothetical protein
MMTVFAVSMDTSIYTLCNPFSLYRYNSFPRIFPGVGTPREEEIPTQRHIPTPRTFRFEKADTMGPIALAR